MFWGLDGGGPARHSLEVLTLWWSIGLGFSIDFSCVKGAHAAIVPFALPPLAYVYDCPRSQVFFLVALYMTKTEDDLDEPSNKGVD